MQLSGQGNSLGSGQAPSGIIKEDFSINNFGIMNSKIYVTDFTRIPKSENKTYNNPLSSGRSLLSSEMRGGTISVSLTIKGDTQEDFMERLNKLYEEIYLDDVCLFFTINKLQRKAKVICASSPINFNHTNITHTSLTLVFEYLENIQGLNKQVTSLFNKTGNFNQEITNKGNSESLLDIIFVFKGNTALTNIKIENGNDYILIPNTFEDGDILKIDGEEKETFKNGEIIDYDKLILKINPGSNRIFFEFTGDVQADIFMFNDINYK